MVRRPKDLSTSERNLCVQLLLRESENGKPKRGMMLQASTKFNISTRTVSRLWKAAKEQQAQRSVIHLISKKEGRTRDHNLQPDYARIAALHVSDRRSFRRMEELLHVSRSTLSKWYKAGLFRAHTSSIKPSLTEKNKLSRIMFSLEALEIDRVMNRLRFQHMYNAIHIDEKWFYITKGSNRYYLTPDEEEPYRACQSKKFIGKIMFLCAVGRPLLREDGSVLFDSKIGIFPFTEQYTSVRGSKNRPRGTLVTRALDSITREVMKNTLINKVLPAIRQKWPSSASKNIQIQQDNAKPHITDDDADFRQAATKDGFNIKLVQQPPNSPDTNINDLGFFNAIQALQQRRTCKTVDDLVQAVKEAFYQLAPSTLNKVFLTLQGCLTEILKAKGHNNYKTPHMGKDRMIREGTLPISLHIPLDLARDSVQFLIDNGQIRGVYQLINRLDLQQVTGIDQASSSS